MYIQSFVKIGPPVLEKIFEGFLPYMGVAAILVKFRSPYPGRLHINFGFIGQAVSEEKMFEHCGRRTTYDDDGPRTMGILYISSPMSLPLR